MLHIKESNKIKTTIAMVMLTTPHRQKIKWVMTLNFFEFHMMLKIIFADLGEAVDTAATKIGTVMRS